MAERNADIIRLAADTGADGVDLTVYWLPDTSDRTLYELRKLAYRSGVSIYTIGIRARMAQPTAELQAAEIATVRQWIDAADGRVRWSETRQWDCYRGNYRLPCRLPWWVAVGHTGWQRANRPYYKEQSDTLDTPAV